MKKTTKEMGSSPIPNQDKLWTSPYIMTLMVNMVINISGMMLIALLPLYMIDKGGNNVVAGTLTTILTVSALICRPIFGRMLDVWGRRITLLVGIGIFALATLMLTVADQMSAVFVLRFLQGIGLSGYSTALGTILSDVVPSRRISEGVGYFGISATIAMAVGPSMSLYFADVLGYQITFVISFGFAVLSGGFAYMLRYEKKREGQTNPTPKSMRRREDETGKGGFIEKSTIRVSIVSFFVVVSISAVFSFMPLYAAERNINNIGLFFTAYAVVMTLTRLFTGKMADRYGIDKIYLPAVLLTAMIFVTLAVAKSLPMVLLAAVFYGVGYGTLQPIFNTIVIKLSPPERRGAANATYYATLDISFGLGSFIWGMVSQYAGFTAVFVLCAVSVTISLGLYYLILRRPLMEAGH